jgi:hypothetical protein
MISLFIMAFYIVGQGPTSPYMVILAAFLHAFGNQNMAFILHDASHNSVT